MSGGVSLQLVFMLAVDSHSCNTLHNACSLSPYLAVGPHVCSTFTMLAVDPHACKLFLVLQHFLMLTVAPHDYCWTSCLQLVIISFKEPLQLILMLAARCRDILQLVLMLGVGSHAPASGLN